VIPIADRPVAVAKQEVAFKIRTDDAYLLAPPPMRLEWPPVVLPDQTGNDNVRVAAREDPATGHPLRIRSCVGVVRSVVTSGLRKSVIGSDGGRRKTARGAGGRVPRSNDKSRY